MIIGLSDNYLNYLIIIHKHYTYKLYNLLNYVNE